MAVRGQNSTAAFAEPDAACALALAIAAQDDGVAILQERARFAVG
jgi:hypothetical protein